MIVSAKRRAATSPEALAKIAREILGSEDEIDQMKEHFSVLGLNTKNVVQYVDLCSLGVLDASLVHPREVFRLAIAKGVSCIACAHNHPSGDVYSSMEDRKVTDRLKQAGDLLGVAVLDHVIASNESDTYYSFKEETAI